MQLLPCLPGIAYIVVGLCEKKYKNKSIYVVMLGVVEVVPCGFILHGLAGLIAMLVTIAVFAGISIRANAYLP